MSACNFIVLFEFFQDIETGIIKTSNMCMLYQYLLYLLFCMTVVPHGHNLVLISSVLLLPVPLIIILAWGLKTFTSIKWECQKRIMCQIFEIHVFLSQLWSLKQSTKSSVYTLISQVEMILLRDQFNFDTVILFSCDAAALQPKIPWTVIFRLKITTQNHDKTLSLLNMQLVSLDQWYPLTLQIYLQ